MRASGDGDELRGDALVAGGTLELCRAMTNFSGGSQGTLVIGRKHSAPRAIVRSFELAFEFQAVGGSLPSKNDGFCFAYGLMPEGGEPFGTAGTRRGLSICMLIGASGPSGGSRVRGEERMQKMRISLEDEVLLEVDLGHHRHEYDVWSNMSIRVEGYDASPACTGMDTCAADSTTFEHGAAAALRSPGPPRPHGFPLRAATPEYSIANFLSSDRLWELWRGFGRLFTVAEQIAS